MGPEPRVSSPIALCTCQWVGRDHGQGSMPVRVRETPGCIIHDKREETNDSTGSEPSEP